jgi:hypothetical protein
VIDDRHCPIRATVIFQQSKTLHKTRKTATLQFSLGRKYCLLMAGFVIGVRFSVHPVIIT